MMEQLSRTVSTESTRSRTSPHILSSGTANVTTRKARSIDPDTTSGNAERASISMPPPASLARQYPSRRPSKASDSGILTTAGLVENLGALRNGSAIDETETTPTLEGSRGGSISTAQTLTLPDAARRQSRSEVDTESNRMSFSSLYSLGSAIYNGTRALSGSSSVISEPEGPAQGTTTATSSLSVTTSSQGGSLGPSSSPFILGKEHSINPSIPTQIPIGIPHVSTSPQLGQPARQQQPRRSRSRTTTQRRISGSTAASSSPASREIKEASTKKMSKGIIGICALESKARSKPARNIFGKLIEEFDVNIFGDKIILDEDVENWPVCDFLISFFSDGFPLDKAIAYARLRKPFCVNDLPMQQVLWDRRLCLRILDNLDVPTPKRVEVNRDGGPTLPSPEFAKSLFERTGVKLQGPESGIGGGIPPPQKVELRDGGDTIWVDGQQLTKPFVEKPTSGEDHNINIYFPKKHGGGGRRLFRKINNKSSERDDTLDVPRSITDSTSSYIYEQFLQVENAEDVKAYTVGPDFCHAETRKSPVVDGLVKRNPSGKEVRYVTRLSTEEAAIASRISEGFGQRVCGFDLLRAGDKSYVIDVNGWSFVKDNESYYDKAASILKEMFLKEVQRKERKEGKAASPQETQETAVDKNVAQPPSRKNTTSGHRSALKGLFKSPSMSRLTSHHPHIPIRPHGTHPTSSPDTSAATTPMTATSSVGNPYRSTLPKAPMSQPDLLPDAAVADAKLPLDAPASQSEEQIINVPPPASKAQWILKGMVSVIRHADRTPKQKHKFTFHTKPFVDLLKGHQEEVLLIGEAALNSVNDAVKLAVEEGEEDSDKLRELKVYLNKKGGWPGTKVQIKPMFRKRKKHELLPGTDFDASPDLEKDVKTLDGGALEDQSDWKKNRSDSMSGVTLSRIAAVENNLVLDKLQLIIKWGGEPTHSARYQAQDLGANFRNDLLLLNREVLDDVSVFSSSERRVTTSAQIFAASFLNQKEFPEDHIEIRKDLLDDSNAAKDEMDKVKKKLKSLLREGNKAPPQFAWPKDNMPEPYLVVRQVVDLMKFHQKVMNHNYKKIESGAVTALSAVASPSGDSPTTPPVPGNSLSQVTNVNSIQSRWCCGEGPELFKERWEKLFREFGDADKVDPSKISELYDTMKFDALHNRQFLEWIFTPDSAFLDEDPVGPVSSGGSEKSGSSDPKDKPPSIPQESKVKNDPKEQQPPPAAEKSNIAQRMGFRRKSEAAAATLKNNAAVYPHESYFTLYTGVGNAASKVKTDARLVKLREMYKLCKVLFDYIGPQEYGIDNSEKLEIGLLTSLPLLKEIVEDLEELQASDGAKSFFYFTKESHIYTLLNCILEGGIKAKIERNAIPELDYLSQIGFELYESQNQTPDDQPNTFNYSIRITLSPGCHTFAPLDVQLDSKHMIGFSPRRSLTAHHDWKEVLETLRAKFHTVKLPKSFVAINLSEKVPDAFRTSSHPTKDNEEENETDQGKEKEKNKENEKEKEKEKEISEPEPLPPPVLDG
ncbi:uncharacterized protein BDZ99DRAFT_566894 [Mytilinidion resinicola]|uniref:Inositol hexakisphosphate and diphosphoinositol-pentakisphosphate kinase n=1 Tax=Mytilinidion resinicola TaxID=574789 RepID=A0A6A6Z1D8_9PEZI|nr:uncharacterized protein BDZ99DRAFT_566894 [Mytilinidion resinicola]KAF2814982.1 hypothetical protein BDZ99DRAFT_566894 [Mytilinidion resinicola]